MALVLALGALGVGFAHWADTVVVTEVVSSGTMCVSFDEYPLTITDYEAPPPYYPTDHPDLTCDPLTMTNVRPVCPPKNVAWGNASWIDEDTVQVTLHNVYPCYYNHVDFWASNCGTIPVIMDYIEIYDGVNTQLITTQGIYHIDLNHNGYADFEINWGHPVGVGSQIEPGFNSDMSFGMHFIQDNEPPDDMQGQSYTFYLTLHFVQWNKY